MADDTDRLRRLLDDRLGDCCDADVAARRDELATLAASVDDDGDDRRDLRTLSALGSETRLRLARALAAADQPLCVCELAPLVDVGDSAVSHALSELADAGLVDRRKEGKWRYYCATERADLLLDALERGRPDERARAAAEAEPEAEA